MFLLFPSPALVFQDSLGGRREEMIGLLSGHQNEWRGTMVNGWRPYRLVVVDGRH